MQIKEVVALIATLISFTAVVAIIFFATYGIDYAADYFISGYECQRCLQLIIRGKKPLTVTTLVAELGYRPQKAKRVLKYLLHHQLVAKEFDLDSGTDYYILSQGEQN